MRCGNAQTLIGITCSQVSLFTSPSTSTQFHRTEHIIIAVRDIEHDFTLISKAGLFIFNTQQFVVQFEFWFNIITTFLTLCDISQLVILKYLI